MHSCTEKEVEMIGNNDALEQLNSMMYKFHKNARNLEMVYFKELSPKTVEVEERLRITQGNQTRLISNKKVPLFGEDSKADLRYLESGDMEIELECIFLIFLFFSLL